MNKIVSGIMLFWLSIGYGQKSYAPPIKWSCNTKIQYCEKGWGVVRTTGECGSAHMGYKKKYFSSFGEKLGRLKSQVRRQCRQWISQNLGAGTNYKCTRVRCDYNNRYYESGWKCKASVPFSGMNCYGHHPVKSMARKIATARCKATHVKVKKVRCKRY